MTDVFIVYRGPEERIGITSTFRLGMDLCSEDSVKHGRSASIEWMRNKCVPGDFVLGKADWTYYSISCEKVIE